MKNILYTVLIIASISTPHAQAAAPTPGFCTRLSQCLSACFRSSCCTREAPVAQAPAGAPVVAAVPVPAPVPAPAKAAAAPVAAAPAFEVSIARIGAEPSGHAMPGPVIHPAQPTVEAHHFTVSVPVPNGSITITLNDPHTGSLIGTARGQIRNLINIGFIHDIIIEPPFIGKEVFAAKQLCLRMCDEMHRRGCTQATLAVKLHPAMPRFSDPSFLLSRLIQGYIEIGFNLANQDVHSHTALMIKRLTLAVPAAAAAAAAGPRPGEGLFITVPERIADPTLPVVWIPGLAAPLTDHSGPGPAQRMAPPEHGPGPAAPMTIFITSPLGHVAEHAAAPTTEQRRFVVTTLPGNRHYFKVELLTDRGQPIGHAEGTIVNDDTFQVDMLRISPGYEKQGFEKLIGDKTLEEARLRGCTKITKAWERR